ncbi:hypothetical protein KFE25_003361 [Diacronema lutheri]|uniref:Ska2 N-terminal domain-containing protein n=1 Tax=Diacronema lutheri TaxID=2081491 RepID=A0A8J5XCU1_DIALT|nr:hypothetical protein KFE25_003361 [Diacronema lutheri]
MNVAHALSVVECDFDRSATELKRVEETLAREFDALYPRTSINPHKLLERIERLRAELPYLEREADRLVSEKRSAIATVEALKGTFSALADTAARADVRDGSVADGAKAVDQLSHTLAASRLHIAALSAAPVDEAQLIRGGREIDLRLALAEEPLAARAAPIATAISRTDWASVPLVIASSTSLDAVQRLHDALGAIVAQRRDPHLSMSQLVALGAVASADDARLHALGALRKISLGLNEIEVHA